MPKIKRKNWSLGRWSIDSMSEWDKDYIDEEVPGYFEFDPDDLGSFQFGYVQGDVDYRIGDRVIQTVNDYDKDVFNGDLGVVETINRIEQTMVVNFEGRQVEYDFGDLDELSLAYVLSIHKSQGSEFPCVVIPLHTQHYMMLQRNLLYTGVTRGKKLVILVGTKKALGMAVRRHETAKRYTALKGRLRGL